jgi:hypothetical protein
MPDLADQFNDPDLTSSGYPRCWICSIGPYWLVRWHLRRTARRMPG